MGNEICGSRTKNVASCGAIPVTQCDRSTYLAIMARFSTFPLDPGTQVWDTRMMKMAPVQGYSAGIPWDMHLRAYDAYCKKWGPQPAMIDLEGHNCRGGFADTELDMFIPSWREELSERTKLINLLSEARTALETAHGYGFLDVYGNPLPWSHNAKRVVEAIKEVA